GASRFQPVDFFVLSKPSVRAFVRIDEIGKRVQIPRCRATVSEEKAVGHRGISPWEGRLRHWGRCPYSLSQETGVNREYQPLSRVKEDCMCSIRVFWCLAAFLAAASASDLKIKIIDPQSAAVAGSQVSLFPENSSIPFGVQTGSGEGLVLFPGVP